MLLGWFLFHRQCSHTPQQLGWDMTVWSRFKTWEKSACSSSHFVSLELLQHRGLAQSMPSQDTWADGSSPKFQELQLRYNQPRNRALNLQFLHGQPTLRCLNQDSPMGVKRLTGTASISELAPNTYLQLQTKLNGMQDWKFLPRNREQEGFQANASLTD